MQLHRRDIFIFTGTLIVSLVSFLVLGFPWYSLVLRNRTVSGYAGLVFLTILGGVPFAWPYFVAGCLYSRAHPFRLALAWTAAVAVAGVLLHLQVLKAHFAEGTPVSSYMTFYMQHLPPLLFASVGLLLPLLFRSSPPKPNHALQRTGTGGQAASDLHA